MEMEKMMMTENCHVLIMANYTDEGRDKNIGQKLKSLNQEFRAH